MRIAIYPGTFDPVTNGHIDVLERAIEIFDKVIVAVAVNLSKSPLFTPEERVSMIREVTARYGKKVAVDCFSGLVVEYARAKKAIAVVRGLRAVSDFEYEFQIFSSFGTILPQRPHGRSYILAGESKYIIVPGIDIDRSYIGKVVLNIPNQNWEPKTSLPNYNFRFGNVQTSQSQKSVQVSGMLKNDSSSGFPSVNLVGILFDKSGKIINASSTKVDNISAFSEIQFTIFYPPVNNIPEINFAATKVFYEIKR